MALENLVIVSASQLDPKESSYAAQRTPFRDDSLLFK